MAAATWSWRARCSTAGACRASTTCALAKSIGKPYEPETVLRSIAAAREVMRGRTPATLPPGFELFRQAA